jgi:bacterioferritin-associated ferredoxin
VRRAVIVILSSSFLIAKRPRVIVCSCFNVSDRLLRARAREGVPLHAVLAETGAGASCGACRTAIARIHAGDRAEAAPCRVRAAAVAA